ncbi:hypothetical protein BDA96_01G288700 [Sorghum bicolor]|uniref:Uncharacterized protein n=1 Tax=Sorghum bicolor TaxID=4558 RepID=A0A921S0G8_SORBI|nr:hypothetical protein BDA96_10G218400 [Sorghum bicolor]KAG0549833.1 hypothetical protein BDA96_01G288700 [Sorghum bicolor]
MAQVSCGGWQRLFYIFLLSWENPRISELFCISKAALGCSMLDEWPVNSDPSCSHCANLAPGPSDCHFLAAYTLNAELALLGWSRSIH